MSDFDEIPDELKERPQWLMWDSSADAPRRPHWRGDFGVSWTDPDDWHSFEEAVAAAEEEDSWGIGYVFSNSNDKHARGLYGALDLDGCDGDTGPKDWLPSLSPFFDRDAYIEFSPSGEGIHIPIAGFEPPSWWSNVHMSAEEHEGVEAYGSKFFTFTGDALKGSGDTVVGDADFVEEWLIEAYTSITGETPPPLQEDEEEGRETKKSREEIEQIETTNDYDDVFDAVDHLRPNDLRLSSSKTEDENNEWESWDPGYRSSSSGKSLKRSKSSGLFRDLSETNPANCTTFGVLDIFAAEEGIITNPWDDLEGDDWKEAVASAREQGASIPEYQPGPNAKTHAENVDGDGSGKSSKTEQAGAFAHTDLTAEAGGYGYWKTTSEGESYFERVTNFELDVDSFLLKDGERLIDMSVKPSTGENPYDMTVPAKVFNDARRFRDNVVTGFTTTFEGSPSDLNELRKFVGSQDAPRREGTHHMGLHTTEGEFVTPEGVLTGDGWSDDPTMAYIEREIAAERAFELSPDTYDDYDADEVAEILELLPKTRNSERFLPVLGWLYTAPLRPYIQQWEGQFNTLHVTGETGAGKSSTLSVGWQLLGMNGDPMACDDTKFALTTAIASTNSVPMWFDEYKPGDMKDWELDRFQTLMRKSTRGGVETRGNADKSTEEYRLMAPLMISGEQAVQGAAEERRSIQTRFLDNVKEPRSTTREAFAKLTGTAYDAGGETREPEGYDLQQHALAYYQFVLQQDEERLKEQWSRSREHVRELLETHGITGVDDLPRQGIQTIHFGMSMFARFGTGVGAQDLPTTEEIDDALLYVARQFGDKGTRKSHLDRFFELASRAAAEEYIEEGKHYTVVNKGSPEEEIAIKLSRTFDAVSKYARDYALDGEDMLNTSSDYRDRIQEAADKSRSYVNAASQYTTGLNRCVRIDSERAAEKLNFEPESFGAEPKLEELTENDGDGEDPGGSSPPAAPEPTPVGEIDPTKQDRATVVGEIHFEKYDGYNDDDGRPDWTASVTDDTGTATLVAWDEADIPDIYDDQERVAVEQIKVTRASTSEYDDELQLTIQDSTTVEEYEEVGLITSSADADTATATDGGKEGETVAEPKTADEEVDDDGVELEGEPLDKPIINYIEEADGDVDHSDLVENLKERGAADTQIDYWLQKLLDRGDISEPEVGTYR